MADNNPSNPYEYWAAQVDSSKLASSVVQRIKSYRTRLVEIGLVSRMRRSWNAYNGFGPNADKDSSGVLEGGRTGELFDITLNHYSSLATQVTTLTTSAKPSVKAIAANSDFESLGQAQFAEALNDYYDRELAVSTREHEATLAMVLLGESHIVLDWDPFAGKPYATNEVGQTVTTGDVSIATLTPFDVARDTDLQDVDTANWIAFRRKVNKWELAAQYPERRQDILDYSLDLRNDTDSGYEPIGSSGAFQLDFRIQPKNSDDNDSDSVYLWEFRHRPTKALPKGRLIKFISDECVLFDTVKEETEVRPVLTGTEDSPATEEVKVVRDYGYPFGDSLFVYSAAAERVVGGVEGHTPFFDLLSLQELVDFNAGIIASAIRAGGLQNYLVPEGMSLNKQKLGGGLNVIYYKGGVQPPAAISLLDIKPEVPKFIEAMIGTMRQRVSMNEVTTGDIQRQMPAQAMALLRAQSVEFHSRLQASYEMLIQRSRTGILKMLQIFAEAERVAEVAGKGNQWALREFKKQDISGFSRFVVEPVNPALKTLSGKVGFAQTLLEGGMVKTPEQMLQLYTTGRLEPLNKNAADRQASLERAKEMLMEGIGIAPYQVDPATRDIMRAPNGVPMLMDDGQPHLRLNIRQPLWAYIDAFSAILDLPGASDDPKLVVEVNRAIEYCSDLWKAQPAYQTVLLGGRPHPENMQMGPPPMPPNSGPNQAPNQSEAPPEVREDISRAEGSTGGTNEVPVRLPTPPSVPRGSDSGLERASARDPAVRPQ